MQAVWFSQYY